MYSNMVLINCEILKQICSGKALKKHISMVILFDVGGPIMADNASREEGFQIFMYFVHYNHFSRLQID